MIFYDRYGNAISYTDDNKNIFSFKGKALAYIFNDVVYSFSGDPIGWFSRGWVYDISGYPLLYSDEASGGPVTPIKKVAPLKNARSIVPVKVTRKVTKIKPVFKIAWSSESVDNFFNR